MSQLTMLSSMADQDFTASLRKHVEWNIEWLDLRDAIYGKRLFALSEDESRQAKAEIDAAGLKVYCFSTAIFLDDIENGEADFRERHLEQLQTILPAARIIQPKIIRVLAASMSGREDGRSSMETISDRHPWVIDVYREAVDRIADAGFQPTIENEAKGCFLAAPDEFHDFFNRLDRKDVGLTWDVQNHWANGVFPSLEVYNRLKPLMRYYHAKGGRAGDDGRTLAWNVALEEASWPVVEITRQVVADGVSPVICLNPPQHGDYVDGYDYGAVAKRDLDFLRARVTGLS
jgi:sugar phosphate isomerase/epimerase